MKQVHKDRLTQKGRRVPIAKLLEQGRATVRLCRKYPEELSNTGWPAENTEALDQKLFGLDALFSGRSSETEASLKATGTESSSSLPVIPVVAERDQSFQTAVRCLDVRSVRPPNLANLRFSVIEGL